MACCSVRISGQTWDQVALGKLKDDIMAIAVNCNGSAVYVLDLES
jgi:hypothetical protein